MLLAVVGACGGLGPGDALIYRVAYGPGQLGADCLAGASPGPGADSTTFHEAGTLLLYFDADGVPWLDTGRAVLVGSAEGDGYRFAGERVEVEVVPGEIILDADQDGIPDDEDPFVDADMDGVEDSMDDFVDTDGDGIDDRIDDLVDADGDGVDDRYTQLPSNTQRVSAARTTVDVALDGDLISGVAVVAAEARCLGDCQGEPPDRICTTTTPFRGVRLDHADVSLPAGESPFE